MPKISVIIPVYNTEKYLRECLDSVINQTLADIEIICVNDGSTDSSLQILQDYAQKDKRITVLTQKNKGAGVARNLGLKNAKGEYVIFFDSDDYMNMKMLEKLYNRGCETGSDITICKSEYLNKKDSTKIPISFAVEKNCIGDVLLLQPKDYAKCIFQFCVGWPWDKLYKRDFVVKNKLKFQKLRHSNDTYFVLFSLVLANCISIVDDILVTHRTHENSLESTRVEAPSCFYFALSKMWHSLKKLGDYKTYEYSFINYCVTFPYWHIISIKNKKARKKMVQAYAKLYKKINMKKYEKEYFNDIDSYMYLKEKIENKVFTKNIFSIKNSNDKLHKIVNIAGIRIKFKRK